MSSSIAQHIEALCKEQGIERDLVVEAMKEAVRAAVRSNVYEQYIDKIGDLVNGYVKRFERGNIIVDLGNLEAILPRSQQSRGEQWNQGERIRVVINNVSKESKGPQIEVSRTSP